MQKKKKNVAIRTPGALGNSSAYAWERGCNRNWGRAQAQDRSTSAPTFIPRWMPSPPVPGSQPITSSHNRAHCQPGHRLGAPGRDPRDPSNRGPPPLQREVMRAQHRPATRPRSPRDRDNLRSPGTGAESLAGTLPRLLSPGLTLPFTGPQRRPRFLRPRGPRAWRVDRRMPRVTTAAEGVLLATQEKDRKAGVGAEAFPLGDGLPPSARLL